MSKIGRNTPCPCGSGLKYKKCCLLKNEPAVTQMMKEITEDIYKLDDLSNSVLPMIKGGEFDKAEAVCEQLLREYPNQIDGLDRFAMLYKAKGETAKAIEYYQKSIEFVKTHDGFDPEFIDINEKEIARLQAASGNNNESN